MQVHIIRHTAVDVPQGMCYGQTDVPLRNTFQQEAQIVKEQIQTLSFEQVFTSPLSRCTRLATYCGYPDATRDDRLKELNFGQWEWTLLYENQSPQARYWFDHQLTEPTPGGESIMQLKERFLHFIDEKKQQGLQRIALFAHGGILLSAMLAHGLTVECDIFHHLPPYGSIRSFEF